MSSGRNSKTKEELKAAQISYHSIDVEPDMLAALEKSTPDEVAEFGEFDIIEHEEPITEDEEGE